MKLRACCIILSLALCAAAGCSKRAEQRGARPTGPVPVKTALAESRDVPDVIRAVGTVEPEERATVRFEVGGILREIRIGEGSEVEKGTPLAIVDRRTLESDLARVEAALARETAALQNARREATRYEDLAAKDFASAARRDEAATAAATLAASVQAASQSVATAALQLERATVTAPISGRTGQWAVRPGDLVKGGETVLTTINRVSPILVSFAVPSARLPHIVAGHGESPLRVTASPDGGKPAEGELCFVDNAVNPDTGTITLKARFANADRSLWPGQFVTVKLTVGTDLKAVAIPSVAVQSGQDGQYVYAVKADSTVEKRVVRITREEDGISVVSAGLSPGEVVVTDGHLRVTPGSTVSEAGAEPLKKEAPPAARNTKAGSDKAQ